MLVIISKVLDVPLCIQDYGNVIACWGTRSDAEKYMETNKLSDHEYCVSELTNELKSSFAKTFDMNEDDIEYRKV